MKKERNIVEISAANGISERTVLEAVSTVLNAYHPVRVDIDGATWRPIGRDYLPVEQQVTYVLFSKMYDASPSNRLIMFTAWHCGNKVSFEFVWRQNRRR